MGCEALGIGKPQKALLAWYRIHGRHDLPWRQTKDPYAIYLSEIMLQQTTVKTVLERYYAPFLRRFPTLQSIAHSELEDVLKAWEGLGYYRRAKNLYATACACQGRLPTNAHDLEKLPGIGKTTAHAIAAFAYGEGVPILDANVKRVLCRVYGLQEASLSTLWSKAWDFFVTTDPYGHNQALMDLGAMVCKSTSPACEQCPLFSFCLGSDDPLSYKEKKTRKEVPTRFQTLIIPYDRQKRLGMWRREGAFLHGLWGFAQVPQDQQEWVYDKISYDLSSGVFLGKLSHVYTHFRLEVEVIALALPTLEPTWMAYDQLSSLPLSKIDIMALALLGKSSSQLW